MGWGWDVTENFNPSNLTVDSSGPQPCLWRGFSKSHLINITKDTLRALTTEEFLNHFVLGLL